MCNHLYVKRIKRRQPITPMKLQKDKDGRIFYSNADNLEEGQELVVKLISLGYDAAIGPRKAYSFNCKTGLTNLIPNRGQVGVYVKKEKTR